MKGKSGLGIWRLPGSGQWWLIFGIGVALGCVVFGMRLFLAEAGADGEPVDWAAEEDFAQADDSHRGVLPRPVHLLTSGRENRGLANEEFHDISMEEKAPPVRLDKTGKPSESEPSGKTVSEEQGQDGKGADSAEGRTGTSDRDRSVKPAQTAQPAASGSSALADIQVRVYLNGTGKIEKVPMETYVLGVLAGEMPTDFELEALKAQAIAARTYIVRRLASGVNELASRGADVTDTVQHQVYLSKSELARRWQDEPGAEKLAKLERAVRETAGLIVTYEGEPIEAAFFSTSNGYTENSEEIWSMPLPYLRSVASPWDKELSPRYRQEAAFKLPQFYRLMGLSGKAASSKPSIKIIEKTEGKRIKSLRINGSTFTGREVRERLGLASSQFSWKIGKGEIIFTTYGLGHGVGMSQWGANGMAKEGGKAADILLHYYTGAKVEPAAKLP